MDLAPGDIFEQRYEIRSELADGMYGALYRATSLDSGRDVAVRLLVQPESGYPDGFENKFMAESKRVSKLRHVASVHLESYGATEDGGLYLVTEYIPGSTLDVVMDDEEIPVRDAIGLVKRLAESLGEAHERGLIHHELKPRNIAVPLRRGVLGAKLRDYGITKSSDAGSGLTTAASPRYLSPEQLLGEEVGFASNIYSLGLIAFELLTHEPCIKSTSYREILAAHLSTTPFSIPATVPPAMKPVLEKMIAKSQGDRFQSTEELLTALLGVDRTSLGLTAQLKVARMVAALEASEDDGGNAADTIVDPGFLDPATEEATRERFKEDVLEDVTERPEEMTPTNVVVSDDITQLAEESSAPALARDASEEEPTDELEDQTQPKKRPQTIPPTKIKPPSGKPSSRKRSSKKPSSGKPSSSRRRKKKRRPSSRSRQSPPKVQDEDRVSGKFAAMVLIGAVGITVVLFLLIISMKSACGPSPSSEQIARAVTHPVSVVDPTSATRTNDPIPSIALDVGAAPSFDMAAIRTGCGIDRATGWSVEKPVAGLVEHPYDAYVPSSYTGAPIPVILAAHPPAGGRGIAGKRWAQHVGLVALAEELPAILLAPKDESIRPWLKDLPGAKEEFTRVLEHAAENFCVDLGRVFGVGMSTGAQALERFACEHPDRFRALALVAHWESKTYRCPDGTRPATMVVNGLADKVSPITGGGGCYGMDLRLPLDDATARLRDDRSCADTASTWAEHEDGACKAYDECAQDLVVCLVPEGAHGWPGSKHSVVRCFDEFDRQPNLTSFPTTELVKKFLGEQLK